MGHGWTEVPGKTTELLDHAVPFSCSGDEALCRRNLRRSRGKQRKGIIFDTTWLPANHFTWSYNCLLERPTFGNLKAIIRGASEFF